MRILKDEFRCAPRQSLSKARTVKVARFVQRVVGAVEKTRLRSIAANLPKALGDLTESEKVCTIFYERFRCESIHGATIILNAERFFSETGVYWETRHSDFYGAFEMIEFLAQFLLGCLERCIDTYRRHLLATGKIPPNIHFHGFGDDVMSGLAFLDQGLLPEAGADWHMTSRSPPHSKRKWFRIGPYEARPEIRTAIITGLGLADFGARWFRYDGASGMKRAPRKSGCDLPSSTLRRGTDFGKPANRRREVDSCPCCARWLGHDCQPTTRHTGGRPHSTSALITRRPPEEDERARLVRHCGEFPFAPRSGIKSG